MRSSTAGFTLVELMVAFAIVALGAVIAVPFLSDPAPAARVRAAARELVASLREARSEAILRNREVVLTLDLETRSYQLSSAQRRRALPSDIEFSLVTAAIERRGDHVANIRFFPDGSSTGGQIRLSKSGQLYEVTVPWLTGRATGHDRAAVR
jgi:general secretion pathway protein H